MQRRRDPREPTPLVLMNPELRVRQLRYAANIEATLMVPLHRYYEVLLDLSMMGLEYLKAMKLERAFIIFKRIEYFIFHRLKDHPGAQSFSSEPKNRIMGRLPMIMYVAQQIIVDFIMPVYERQAAYFRYEELQRRLSIVNPTAWNAIMSEAARREAEFYTEAEKISSRFGVELSSFLPREITPDDNHPSNFPPRTFPTKSLLFNGAQKTEEEASAQAALNVAINSMNLTAESITISGDQPIETLVRNINTMMNNALVNFFTAHQNHVTRFPNASISDVNVPEPSSNILAQVNHQSSTVVFDMTQNDVGNDRRSYSPRVDHMYRMPAELPGNIQQDRTVYDDRNPYEYNPTYSVETYINFLNITYEANSSAATGFRIRQVAHDHGPSPSTAGYMLHLQRVETSTRSFKTTTQYDVQPISLDLVPAIIPEPDPGPPRCAPPTSPLLKQPAKTSNWGIWAKRGAACGPSGMGSLGVLSNLERAREVLDSVPPMPSGIAYAGERIPPSSSYKDFSDVAVSVESVSTSGATAVESGKTTCTPGTQRKRAMTAIDDEDMSGNLKKGNPPKNDCGPI